MTLYETLKESLIEIGEIMEKEALELRLSKLEEENETLIHQQYIIAKQMQFLIQMLTDDNDKNAFYLSSCAHELRWLNKSEAVFKVCSCGMPVLMNYNTDDVQCAMCKVGN